MPSTAANKPKINEILKSKDFRADFKESVDAKAISRELVYSGIIPVEVEGKIYKADDMKTANGCLHEHLLRQGTENSLMKAFNIMIELEGYPRMNEFGKKWREEFEGLSVHFFTII